MSWRITLDGQNLGDPIEWKQDSYTASWSDDFFAVSGSGSFTFAGEAYEYIKGIYDSGYCNTIESKIYICDSLFHTGLIFVSEASFDLIKCTVNVAVSDNGYLAILKNKRKQEYFPGVGKASDQSTIAEAPETLIEFHNVTTGASEGLKKCYRVYDVFDFLVRALTNDTMAFTSDFFSTGLGKDLVLISGADLQGLSYTTLTNNLSISWQTLWDDMRALYCLRGSTFDDNGVITVRIEPFDYWRTAISSLVIDDMRVLTEGIDTEKIYSNVSMGSGKFRQFSDDTPNTSYPNTVLITWDSQTYNMVGECVVDNTLDLTVKKLVIDSNSIENELNGDNVYDREVFLVETDGSSTIQFETLSTGFYYYNQNLNNNSTLQRWSSRIHNSVFSNNGGGLGDFVASLSTDTALDTFVSPDFNNEISDPDGAYNPAFLTGFYTLPASGLYLFEADFVMDVTWTGTAVPSITIQNAFVPSGLFDFQLVEKTLFNPNTSEFTTSNVRYNWTQVYAYEGLVGEGCFLANAAISLPTGVSGTWLAATQWKTTGLIVNNATPVKRNTEYPLTPDQYSQIISDITKPLILKGEASYISEIKFDVFGSSTINTEFSRSD